MVNRRTKSLRSRIVKILGSITLTTITLLLARYKLGPEEWRQTLSGLSTWALAAILLLVGFFAVAFEFLHAFVTELAMFARKGGKASAKWFARIPEALKNVCMMGVDQTITFLTRRSFDGEYRTRVFEDYGLFNDRGLGLINAARLDLEKVYVELRIATHVGTTPLDILGRDVASERADDQTERQSVWDFLQAPKRGKALVVIGAPGSGKTTLLQYLVLTYARNAQRLYGLPRRLPILVELRALGEVLGTGAMPNLAAAIRACWKDSSLSDLLRREPPEWLEKRLRTSSVILLLDGLDEVPRVSRNAVSRWVSLQVREYRECIFVVTSRPGGYAEAPLAESFVLEVQPFSMDQTDKFIEGWYVANEIVASGNKDNAPVRRRASQEANDLRSKLKNSPDLDALTVNPLLLTMVCMVHRYHGALPGSRSQLYGEICQVLLERWRQAKGITDELKGEQTLAVLRPLAEEFMTRETREMPEADVLGIIEGPLASIGYADTSDGPAGSRFLRAVQRDSGLLLEKEAGRWSFAHKTFQEYLTAEFWLRTPAALPDWRDKVASDWWRESLLLFAARTEATQLVEAALSKESPASWALAYQCLTEAQRLAPPTRAKTEALIRKGLASTNPDVFTPAARAYHHLQQRRLKRVSELVEQRVELVCAAEYQLFLQEQAADRLLQFLPPHWRSEKFSSAPDEPILGVLPWQAKGFALWAEGGAYIGSWQLPSSVSNLVSPVPGLVFWCVDETLGGVSSESRLGDALLPVALGITLSTYSPHEVESALAPAIGNDFGLTRNLPLLLARSLEYALSTAFGREPQLSQAQAAAFAFGVNKSADVERIMYGGHRAYAASLDSFFKHNWGDRPQDWRTKLQNRITPLLSTENALARKDVTPVPFVDSL